MQAKKQRAAVTDRPRKRGAAKSAVREGNHSNPEKKRSRAIPAAVRREVFKRDAGSCRFVDAQGRQCGSNWQVELHHRIPFAQGGQHTPSNLELRRRAHNQWQAEMDYGAGFMERWRGSG